MKLAHMRICAKALCGCWHGPVLSQGASQCQSTAIQEATARMNCETVRCCCALQPIQLMCQCGSQCAHTVRSNTTTTLACRIYHSTSPPFPVSIHKALIAAGTCLASTCFFTPCTSQWLSKFATTMSIFFICLGADTLSNIYTVHHLIITTYPTPTLNTQLLRLGISTTDVNMLISQSDFSF